MLLSTGPGVRQAIASWTWQLSRTSVDTTILDGIADEAEALSASLRECGIQGLDGTGLPAAEMHEDPYRPLDPASGLLSAYLYAAGIAAWKQWDAAGTEADRVRILSCCGPTSGRSLVSMLGPQSTHFADWQFCAALKWRVGMCEPPANARCKNLKQNGEPCREPLSSDHAVDCPCGPLRNRRHNDLAEDHASFIEEAGGLARLEVYVPEMSTAAPTSPDTKCKNEAWLDVWGYRVCK